MKYQRNTARSVSCGRMRIIHPATSRFSPARLTRTEAGVTPSTARPAAATAPAAMAPALTTLLAATIRACSALGERSWIRA